MPRSSEKTLQAIRAAAFRLFFKRGYTRVSMDDIAEEAGVTKRTLYYHFDSKDALLDYALGKGAEQSDATTQNWKNSSAKSSHEFLDGLILGLVTWAKTKGWTGSGFSRLSLELADLPGHPVRKAAKLHKMSVQTWIEKELLERGDKNASSNARSNMNSQNPLKSIFITGANSGLGKEAARQLAELAILEGGDGFEPRLQFVGQRLLARPFTKTEQRVAGAAFKDIASYYDANEEDAKKVVSYGDSKPSGRSAGVRTQ